MYPPRVISSATHKAQAFLKIQTKYSILELVKDQAEYMKKTKLALAIKETMCEHICRIGIILGVNNQFGSKQ